MGYNIRSLLPKINQFKFVIYEDSFDITCLCETWLKPTIETQLINIPGYSAVWLD